MSALGFLLAFAAMAVLVLGLIAVGLPLILTLRRWAAYRRAPELQAEARVVDKRTQLTGQRPASQRYFVTFQFADGNRVELPVPAVESGYLVVGDQGTLSWRGSAYRGFAREILR